MNQTLTRLWTGKVPLAQAVWHYAVVYGLLINAVSSFVAFALFTRDLSPVFGLAFFVAPIPYNLLVLVAVWRSAERYEGPAGRAELARWATLVWMILLSVV